MGVRIGIGNLKIGSGGGTSWSSYWAAQDLNLWAKGRSDLVILDDFGNNVAILPSYAYNLNASNYFKCVDNGALDINNTDFTMSAMVCPETVNGTYKYICGKTIQNINGTYGFYWADTDYYSFGITTSTTYFGVVSNVKAVVGTWVNLRADINATTKLIRFYVNGVLQGAGTNYTGTFSHLANTFTFNMGIGQLIATGDYNYLNGSCSLSDVFLFRRILSAEDITLIANRGCPAGALAHYPLLGLSGYNETDLTKNNYAEYDASGNGYHLTGVGIIPNKYKFSDFGSRHGLNIGFTIYSNGYTFVYVPFTDAGTEISNPPVLAGFTKLANHAGRSSQHNLANSKLRFVAGSGFDRSNVTIWNNAARLYSNTADSTYYDSTNKTDWHVEELVNLKLSGWANVGYKGRKFVKISDHSYGYRKVLEEIMCFDTDRTGVGLNKALTYCYDYVSDGIYENESIYWKFDTETIAAIRGQKILKFNTTTSLLSLSIDNGLTYPYTKTFTGVTDCQFAYIWNNGNISFASGTKFYLSTDNLANYSEVVPTGADGQPFVASADENFHVNSHNKQYVIGGIEYLIIPQYSNKAGGMDTNMNMWLSKDNGVSLKSIFKANYTAPGLAFKHFHSLGYNEADGSWWFTTGDAVSGADCRIVRFTETNNVWTFVQIAVGDDLGYYKTITIGFVGTDAYWGMDAGKMGIIKVPIANIASQVGLSVIYRVASAVYRLIGGVWDVNNHVVFGGIPEAMFNLLIVSNDGGVTFKGTRIYGSGVHHALFPITGFGTEKADGWSYVNANPVTPNVALNTQAPALWFKIK